MTASASALACDRPVVLFVPRSVFRCLGCGSPRVTFVAPGDAAEPAQPVRAACLACRKLGRP